MTTAIKVGQQVKITNKNKTYSLYDVWALAHIPKQYPWKRKVLPTNGTTGEVVAVAPHRSPSNRELCAVFDKNANATYIINVRGVALAEEALEFQPEPEKTDNHEGMIHNPITNEWSWF